MRKGNDWRNRIVNSQAKLNSHDISKPTEPPKKLDTKYQTRSLVNYKRDDCVEREASYRRRQLFWFGAAWI